MVSACFRAFFHHHSHSALSPLPDSLGLSDPGLREFTTYAISNYSYLISDLLPLGSLGLMSFLALVDAANG